MASPKRTPPAHPILTPQGDPYLDYGPALPERAGVERVFAIARDPETVWAWWEIQGAERATLRDVERGIVAEVNVPGPCGTHFFTALPDRRYVVEVDGRVSNVVRTPRRDPATEVDPDWVPVGAELELLKSLYGKVPTFRRAGYAAGAPRSGQP